MLGTVLGSDGPCGPSGAFLADAPSPEQTAAGWVVLGGIVEILGKLWAFSSWEGVGRCVWVGDGMTAPPWGIPWGCQVMVVMAVVSRTGGVLGSRTE